MSVIRQFDTHLKLYACFAVLLCLSTALSLWLLGQLGQMHAVTAGAAQKLSVPRGRTAGAAQEKLVNQAIAAMDQATRHNAGLVERATAAAASMRDQAGSLSRATGAFMLGQGHASTAPAIHLVASKPNKLSKPRPARLAPMRAVPARPAAPGAGLRSLVGAARCDLDWEQF